MLATGRITRNRWGVVTPRVLLKAGPRSETDVPQARAGGMTNYSERLLGPEELETDQAAADRDRSIG